MTGAGEAILHDGDRVRSVRRDAQRAALPLGRHDGRGRRPHQGNQHHRRHRRPGGGGSGKEVMFQLDALEKVPTCGICSQSTSKVDLFYNRSKVSTKMLIRATL